MAVAVCCYCSRRIRHITAELQYRALRHAANNTAGISVCSLYGIGLCSRDRPDVQRASASHFAADISDIVSSVYIAGGIVSNVEYELCVRIHLADNAACTVIVLSVGIELYLQVHNAYGFTVMQDMAGKHRLTGIVDGPCYDKW